MIGRTIGQYQIIDKIGEGGMGTVYKAEDTALRRLVALKALARSLADDEEARVRFVREAQAASSLNHPNITTIYELLQEGEERFICMEYVEGKTIRDMVESSRVSVRKAIDIVAQVAEALESAHQKGILHRDIKSANIMVTMEGRAKVMDFGLAHLEKRSQLTRTGTTLGTLSYSSPEQITGRAVDRRSEIFSLGVVFYELLTRKLPFGGSSEAEIVFAIVNNEPEPLKEYREDVPEVLEAVVARMLEKDPDLRYQNCTELIGDLNGVRREFETTTTRIGPAVSVDRGRRLKRTALASLLGAIVVVGAATILIGPRTDRSTDLPRIAVLPFENLGAQEDAYFADGLTDEIISRLTALKGLRPIARSSVLQYRDRQRSLRQIGDELDVAYILEGTVRWERLQDGRNIVRITPRLIQVSDETEIWSAPYTEDFSEIFNIQSDVAEKVALSLDVSIGEPERKALALVPTRNMEAYQAYVRGRDYAGRPGVLADNTIIVRSFQRAVELDPGFALAWGELAKAQANMYFEGWDRSPGRLAEADRAAREALRMGASYPEVHRSLGYYYYWGYRDYDKALEELRIAEEGLPNDAGVISARAAIFRRQDKFEEALDAWTAALPLNPRDANVVFELAITDMALRRYAEAETYLKKSMELVPDQSAPSVYLVFLYLVWEKKDLARALIEQLPYGSDPLILYARLVMAASDRNFGRTLELLDTFPEEAIQNIAIYAPKSLWRAWAYGYLGRPEDARAEFENARRHLEARVRAVPEDPRVRIALAQAYAGLGRKAEAIEQGRTAIDELLPVSLDALMGREHVRQVAETYTTLGEYDTALDMLEDLLSHPGFTSIALLEADPFFDPLRDLPRYRSLKEKYGRRRPPL